MPAGDLFRLPSFRSLKLDLQQWSNLLKPQENRVVFRSKLLVHDLSVFECLSVWISHNAIPCASHVSPLRRHSQMTGCGKPCPEVFVASDMMYDAPSLAGCRFPVVAAIFVKIVSGILPRRTTTANECSSAERQVRTLSVDVG